MNQSLVREKARQLVDELKAKNPSETIDRLYRQFIDEALALLRTKHPKAAKKLGPVPEDVNARWPAVARAWLEVDRKTWNSLYAESETPRDLLRKLWKVEEAQIQAGIVKLAPYFEPQKTETPNRVLSVYSTAYLQAGFAHEAYAKGAAEYTAWTTRCHGIPAEVRSFVESTVGPGHPHLAYRTSDPVSRYETWVWCDFLDFTMLQHKPFSKKAAFQWYYNHGLNPRVIRPEIPLGLEETLGVKPDQHLPLLDLDGNPYPE